ALAEAEALARGESFRDDATTTAPDAAKIILDGVQSGQWRILVGPDALAIDAAVRGAPETAYQPGFGESIFGFIQRGDQR
ncbi:MAG: hypothetical protein AAFS03_04440, partial [Pseudomonadota bacterium]